MGKYFNLNYFPKYLLDNTWFISMIRGYVGLP